MLMLAAVSHNGLRCINQVVTDTYCGIVGQRTGSEKQMLCLTIKLVFSTFDLVFRNQMKLRSWGEGLPNLDIFQS